MPSTVMFWALTFAAVVCTCLKVAPIFFISLCSLFFPNFRIGRSGLLAFHDVSWEGRRVWVDGKGLVQEKRSAIDAERKGLGGRTRISIDAVEFFRPTKTGKRWFIALLRIRGARICVPKAHLQSPKLDKPAASPPSPASPMAKGEQVCALKPSTPALPIASWPFVLPSWIKRILVGPVIEVVILIVRFVLLQVLLLGVEFVDAAVEVEGIAHATISVCAGTEFSTGKRGKVGIWLALNSIVVRATKAEDCSDSEGALAASIVGPIDAQAYLPLDPALGTRALGDNAIAGLLLTPNSIHIRVHSRKQGGPIVPWFGSKKREETEIFVQRLRSIIDDILQEVDTAGNTQSINPDKSSSARNLLAYLGVVSVRPPDSILHLPRSSKDGVGLSIRIKGSHAAGSLGNMTSRAGDEFHEWFGKSENILADFTLHTDVVEVNAGSYAPDGSENGSYDDSATQIIYAKNARLHVKSSWLPHSFRRSLGHTMEQRPWADFDRSLLAAAVEIETFKGEATANQIDHLSTVTNAAREALAAKLNVEHQVQDEYESDPDRIFQDVPQLVTSFVVTKTSTMRMRGPADPHASSPKWQWTDNEWIQLEIPAITCSVNSTFADICVRLDDGTRSQQQRMARRNDLHVPESLRDVVISPAHSAAILADRRTDDSGFVPDLDGFGPDAAYPFPAPTDRVSRTHLDAFRSSKADLVCEFEAGFRFGGLNITLNGGESSNASPWRVLKSDPIDLTVNMVTAGFYDEGCFGLPSLNLNQREGSVKMIMEGTSIELWRPEVLSMLTSMIEITKGFRVPRPKSQVIPLPKPRSKAIPRDLHVLVGLYRLSIRVAGVDPKTKSDRPRGINFVTEGFVVEAFRQSSIRPGLYYFPDREKLGTSADIRMQCQALVSQQRAQNDLLMVTFASHSTRIKCDLDAHQFQTEGRPSGPSSSTGAERLPRTRMSDDFMHLGQISILCRFESDVVRPLDGDVLTTLIRIPSMTMHVELLQIYCILNAVSTLKSLLPQPVNNLSKRIVRPRRPLEIKLSSIITTAQILLVLSKQAPLLFTTGRAALSYSSPSTLGFKWDLFSVWGRSATEPGLWDDILGAKSGDVSLCPKAVNTGWHDYTIVISGDALRFRIPYKYVLADALDGVGTFVKAIKQLSYEFLTGGHGSVLEPEVETAKHVPEIVIQFRIVVIQLEDDLFETKLNAIRRAGAEEVPERHLREECMYNELGRSSRGSRSRSSSACSLSQDGTRPSSPVGSQRSGSTASSGYESLTEAEALTLVEKLHATEWTKRMRNLSAEQQRQEEFVSHQLYGRLNSKVMENTPVDRVSPTSRRTPLLRLVLNDVDITVGKASFGDQGLADFLHDVGKGMPRDTQYSLLIPFHLKWCMAGAEARIRDYPLSLLHLPLNQDHSVAWSLTTDFVIAEQMASSDAIRWTEALILPAKAVGEGQTYSMTVPRTAASVKTYANPTVRITSMHPFQLGWGNSMQPAIQDISRTLETLSKASKDPSPKIGFWDKIRLVLHWSITVNFEGEGDVLLHLKGSRDPYDLQGYGAGFAKVWRGNVKFFVGHENKDEEFFQILSDEFVLGVPDLEAFESEAAAGAMPLRFHDERFSDDVESSLHFFSRPEKSAVTKFEKVVGKLTRGVKWGIGMKFERTCRPKGEVELGDEDECECDGGPMKPASSGSVRSESSVKSENRQGLRHRSCRMWTYKPHYEVQLRTPESFGSNHVARNAHDSYRRFRSDFVHLSISLSSTSSEADNEFHSGAHCNSLHFAPELITHFFAWWGTFDNALALPVRQGKLYPLNQQPTHKLGNHLATLKYRFAIAPLFLAHMYRQDDITDWQKGRTSVLGIKARIDSFTADFHQRAVEFMTRRPTAEVPKCIVKKVFYAAEIVAQGADCRAVSATYTDPSKVVYQRDDGSISSSGEEYPEGDMGHDIQSSRWFDEDDFCDLYFPKPEVLPHFKVLEVLSCPSLSYVQKNQNDAALDMNSSGVLSGSEGWTKFGDEPTHRCLVGKGQPAIFLQLNQLNQRLEALQRKVNNCTPNDPRRREYEVRMATIIKMRVKFQDAAQLNYPEEQHSHPRLGNPSTPFRTASVEFEVEEKRMRAISQEFHRPDTPWIHRLLIHSPSILISNSTRDILSKYYWSSRRRKGFTYNLSASIVQMVLQLGEKAKQGLQSKSPATAAPSTRRKARRSGHMERSGVANLEAIFSPDRSPVFEDHEGVEDTDDTDLTPEELAEQDIPAAFSVEQSALFLLIRPQIAFRSEVDESSIVVFTAFGAQLKSFKILDTGKDDQQDQHSVLQRSFLEVTGFQAFHPETAHLDSQNDEVRDQRWHHNLVPIEVLVDLQLEPWGFARLVPRASVSIRYDKFNQLKIKRTSAGDASLSSSKSEHLRSSRDWIKVVAKDRVTVNANSAAYRAIYNVVTDLLLFTDPTQERRNDAVENIVKSWTVVQETTIDAHDGLDHSEFKITDIAWQIGRYQEHIRKSRHTLRHDRNFSTRLSSGVADGLNEHAALECDLHEKSESLALLIEAVRRIQSSTAQDKESGAAFELNAFAKLISWQMLGDDGAPFAKLAVDDTFFVWYSRANASISNRLAVGNLEAFNTSPDTDFHEILSKFDADSEVARPILRVGWNTLPPVGGIPIIDNFELAIHPIRLQLEAALGGKIQDYIFTRKSDSGKQKGRAQPSADSDKRSENSRNGRSPNAFSNAFKPPHSFRLRAQTMGGSDAASVLTRGTDQSLIASSRNAAGKIAMEASSSTSLLRPGWLGGPGRSGSSSVRSPSPSTRSFNGVGSRHRQVEDRPQDSIVKIKEPQVLEMKQRARLYRSFHEIDVLPTVIILSYKGPKIPDIFNLMVMTPTLKFRSEIWSYREFFTAVKSECTSSLFKQSPSLLGQFLTRARKPKALPAAVMSGTRKVASGLMGAGFTRVKGAMRASGPSISSPSSRGRSCTTASMDPSSSTPSDNQSSLDDSIVSTDQSFGSQTHSNGTRRSPLLTAEPDDMLPNPPSTPPEDRRSNNQSPDHWKFLSSPSANSSGGERSSIEKRGRSSPLRRDRRGSTIVGQSPKVN